MKKSIDVRGLACPEPVLETKKALEKEDFDVLEIITDNETAKENLSSLLKKMNFQILSISQKEQDYHILVAAGNKQIHQSVEIEKKPVLQEKLILFTSDSLGDGDKELGKMLMKAFTFTLTKLEQKPALMIFMNSGVKLCIEGAETIPNLEKLAAAKIPILVCGTCLNFYHLQDKLQVGEVSNMYDISEKLLGGLQIVSI